MENTNILKAEAIVDLWQTGATDYKSITLLSKVVGKPKKWVRLVIREWVLNYNGSFLEFCESLEDGV